MCVDVELAGALIRGQAIADRRATSEARKNADVCLDVEVAEFNRRFLETFTAPVEGGEVLALRPLGLRRSPGAGAIFQCGVREFLRKILRRREAAIGAPRV